MSHFSKTNSLPVLITRQESRPPLDILKIDRAFVQNLTDNRKDQVPVWSIIALAHGLERSVAAEGVETAGQRDLLLGMDCDCLQGFLYSPAVPPSEMPDHL